jgi:hypothetical protein
LFNFLPSKASWDSELSIITQISIMQITKSSFIVLVGESEVIGSL